MSESESYRLLRFEIPGFALFFYILILLAPFLATADISQGRILVILSFAGTVFVASVPVGYLIHQFYVNRYRMPTTKRKGHRLLESWIDEDFPQSEDYRKWSDEQRFTFVDSLLAFSYSLAGESEAREVRSSLAVRWSHFYARSAMGTNSLLISAAFVAAIGICTEWIFSSTSAFDLGFDRIAVSGVIFGVLFVVLFFMNTYRIKLFDEISAIEVDYLLANERSIRDFLKKLSGKTRHFM